MGIFDGGRRAAGDPIDGRLPPGQHITDDWPVLSIGPTAEVSTDDWSFTIATESGIRHRWDWDGLHAVGLEDIVVDIHCVTHWSKLAMTWRGVSLDRLFDEVESVHDYAMAISSDGYTTNLAIDDLLDGQAWIAVEADGEPLEPVHGGPARLLVPHLYFWKSAKWVRGLRMMPSDDPGFWEQNGYHPHGDPWQEERYW